MAVLQGGGIGCYAGVWYGFVLGNVKIFAGFGRFPGSPVSPFTLSTLLSLVTALFTQGVATIPALLL